MVLVDTSVWVDHLRRNNLGLTSLLEDRNVLCHPFVIGELACGRLNPREEILYQLGALPSAPLATQSEALQFLSRHRLFEKGIGFIDLHVLASAALDGARLWTLDKGLREAAKTLRLAFSEG